jgi:membrane-bound lytic murein transglycosylase D
MTKKQMIFSFLLLTVFSVFAQQNINQANSLKDTLVLAVADTVSPGEITIDENEMSIYTSRLDSFSQSWEVKNAFRMDTLDVHLEDEYPKNIPDSVYVQRLQKTQQVVELSFNPAVLGFIKMYTERKRDQVERMLGLSDFYFPMFEELLDKYNLPLELKYLAVIESALDPRAVSHAGAVGLWQFMYGTAKMFNVEISSFVDERRDPVKSTETAVIYLKKLFGIYKDWNLAIAAYNCGPGNVDKAIRRAGGKTNYWEIYSFLPRETRGYVPLFVAATYAMTFYNEHNLIPRVPAMPTTVDTVMVNNYLHFDQLSTVLGIDQEYVRALNPMYRRYIIPATPEKPYPLVLPYNKINEFIDRDTSVYAWERNKYFPNNALAGPVERNSGYFVPDDVKGKSKVVYTVKSGDTVGGIAKKYGVRLTDLAYWNNIKKNMIRAGQKLAIYVPEKSKPKESKPVVDKEIASSETKTEAEVQSVNITDFEFYTVKRGDTPTVIANRFGMKPDELMSINGISSDRGLQVGQKLKIKKKT